MLAHLQGADLSLERDINLYKNIIRTMLTGIAASSAMCAFAQADHLVLSEIGVSAGTEYVEIYNPTAVAVPLDNYYITDYFDYYKLATSPDGMLDTNSSDHLMQFPVGSTIQSGQVVVVASNGADFIDEFFEGDKTVFDNLPNAPLLFETTNSDETILNMITRNSQVADELNFGLTNMSTTNGEWEALIYWDGLTDLVQDVDVVGWGNGSSANIFKFKTEAATGANSTPYKVDAGTWANLTNASSTGQIITRVSITEQGEAATGGNGLNGHDESLENVPTTWQVGNSIVADVSPGTTNLNVVGANLKPIINSAERNIQFPGLADNLIITANVTDADSASVSVKVYYATDTNETFTAVNAVSAGSNNYTANLGAFPNTTGTLVRYYVEATDSDSTLNRYPGSHRTKKFLVEPAPLVPGDIIINEVMYDTPGSDTHEFIELHNTLNVPVQVPGFRIADANLIYFGLPNNAVIPANGYLVVSLNDGALNNAYPNIDPASQVFDWGTFGLNNGGDTINLVHTNDFEFNGATNFLDQVIYSSAAPWPNGAGIAIELINQDLDNSQGANWATAERRISPIGSPGEQNSAYSAGKVTSLVRDIEFPAPNASATVTATVDPLSIASITAVKLFADNGSGFAESAMTASGNIYTGTIPGQAEGTIVRYYIQVENSNGDVSIHPSPVLEGHYTYHVNASPAGAADIVINEIGYDKIGTDNYEWLELINLRNTPLALEGFRVGDSSTESFDFPEGAVIGANSFVVLSYDPVAMDVDYDVPVGIPVYEYKFSLDNGGDTVYVTHANSIGYSASSTPFDIVQYDNVSPWPAINGNVTGKSILLLDPAQDNNNYANWAGSPDIEGKAQSGTPGAPNTPAAVSDWAIY